MNKKICLENLHNILNANNITMSGLTATKQLLYKEDKEPVEYGLINLLINDGNEGFDSAKSGVCGLGGPIRECVAPRRNSPIYAMVGDEM